MTIYLMNGPDELNSDQLTELKNLGFEPITHERQASWFAETLTVEGLIEAVFRKRWQTIGVPNVLVVLVPYQSMYTHVVRRHVGHVDMYSIATIETVVLLQKIATVSGNDSIGRIDGVIGAIAHGKLEVHEYIASRTYRRTVDYVQWDWQLIFPSFDR